jgi:hypothetical protein
MAADDPAIFQLFEAPFYSRPGHAGIHAKALQGRPSTTLFVSIIRDCEQKELFGWLGWLL